MNGFEQSILVTLKDDNWLARQRVAGSCVGEVLKHLNGMIVNQTPNISLRDMEREAEKIITDRGCTPTFKGFKGFPGAICLSVNKDMVHGIPTDYVLQPGDVVKFDLGATFEGAIADAASTAIYGKPLQQRHVDLIDATRKALMNGIKAATVGKRIGAIGYAIHKSVNSTGFGLVTNYGGHGIDENSPHAAPFVPNRAQPTEGVRIHKGMTLAIEPMLIDGHTNTRVQKDGWTVTAEAICAHMEHTIFINDDGPEILTAWES